MSEESQNLRWLSRDESLNLKANLYEQIKLCVREYICVAEWRWGAIFIEKALQEVAERLKNWKDAAIRKKKLKDSEDWNNLLRNMIRNHEQWVYSSTILICWAVVTAPTFLIKVFLPRVPKPSRVWSPEAFFWLSTCPTSAWRIFQWFKKLVSIIGDPEKRRNWEKCGSEEPLQPGPSSCISGKAQEVWTTEIVSSLWLTMPRVSGLVLEVAW